jgi:hypothetical protein
MIKLLSDMLHVKLALLVGLVAITLTATAQKKQTLPFILLNEQSLKDYKTLYQRQDKDVMRQVDSLIAGADEIVKSGKTYSVTFEKSKPAPSGDIHDYISQAPYWWPDTTKADGKPYIRKDGRINPERNLSKDYGQMGKMNSEVKQLALAYFFTANEKYATKATGLLKVWFIDTATRMNPNLNYGQFIPGITAGRGIGIIETAGLTNIPDALAMLQVSKNVSDHFIDGLKQWFSQYTDWLINSKNGKEERAAINNHGTYYDVQLADFALFTGGKVLAEKVIREQTIPRIDQQFTIEGAQPLELIRTKSWGYSTMNLVGWCKLAVIAEKVNVNLWNTTTLDGKGIRRVFDWFSPYMLKEKQWNYEQIEPVSYNNILPAYHLANTKYSNVFQKVLDNYPAANTAKPW